VVAACAEAGDATAWAIVRRNAQARAAMAERIRRRLALRQPPVWAMGGALEHLAPLRRELERALAGRLPAARLSPPAGDACAGALSLARERLEIRRR
jgi:phenylacetic acid degradation operon negative regulatory protein